MKTFMKGLLISSTRFLWVSISLLVLILSAWIGAVTTAEASQVQREPKAREPVQVPPGITVPIREPVIRAPVIRTPTVKTPVARVPSVRAPAVRTQVTRTPAIREAAIRTPALKALVLKAPRQSTTIHPTLTAPAVSRASIKPIVRSAPVIKQLIRIDSKKIAPMRTIQNQQQTIDPEIKLKEVYLLQAGRDIDTDDHDVDEHNEFGLDTGRGLVVVQGAGAMPGECVAGYILVPRDRMITMHSQGMELQKGMAAPLVKMEPVDPVWASILVKVPVVKCAEKI